MEPFKTVDFDSAQANLEKLKARGNIKPAEYRRLKKGISRVQQGQDKGFAYDVDSKKGTFSAKNESGEDARGKIGGVSGMNVLEGRKTSKALGYLSKFTVDPNQQNIPDQVERKKPEAKFPAFSAPKVSPVNPATKTASNKQPKVDQAKMDAISADIEKNVNAQIKPETAPEYVQKKPFDLNTLPKIENPDLGQLPVPNPGSSVLRQTMNRQTSGFSKPDFSGYFKQLEAFETQKKRFQQTGDTEGIKSINDQISEYAKKNRFQYHNGRILVNGQWRSATEAIESNQNGGKVPMAENGFRIQPFKPRTFNNSFIQPPSTEGRFKVNQGIKNRFLTGEKPNFSVPKINKPAYQSWANTPIFNPPAQAGTLDSPAQAGTVGSDVKPVDPLVPYDGSMVSQDRSPRKIDKFGAINTGLGALGFLKTVTAREPNMKPTPVFRDKIRPWSGFQEGLDSTLADIDRTSQRAVSDVNRNAGNSTTSYLTGRAMIQSNTNEAKANAYRADREVALNDRNRFDQQVSNENRINYENEVADQKAKEARDYQSYLSKVQTGQAMMQQSLNYANAKNADQQNKAVALKQVEERMKSVKDAAKYNVLYGAIARGGIESLTPELRAAYDELMGVGVPTGQKGMAISYLKKGGTTPNIPEKILSDANKDMTKMVRTYATFVAKASSSDKKQFMEYIRQINRVNRVNIQRS